MIVKVFITDGQCIDPLTQATCFVSPVRRSILRSSNSPPLPVMSPPLKLAVTLRRLTGVFSNPEMSLKQGLH